MSMSCLLTVAPHAGARIETTTSIPSLGTLDLKIPKLRKWAYFPSFLEPRKANAPVGVKKNRDVQGGGTIWLLYLSHNIVECLYLARSVNTNKIHVKMMCCVKYPQMDSE